MTSIFPSLKNFRLLRNAESFVVPENVTKIVILIAGGGGGGGGSGGSGAGSNGSAGTASSVVSNGVTLISSSGGAGGSGSAFHTSEGQAGGCGGETFTVQTGHNGKPFNFSKKGFLALGIRGGAGGIGGDITADTAAGGGEPGCGGGNSPGQGTNPRRPAGTAGAPGGFLRSFGGPGGGVYPRALKFDVYPGQILTATVGIGGNGGLGYNGTAAPNITPSGGGGGGGAGGIVAVAW